MVEGVLLLCRDSVGVFYSPSQMEGVSYQTREYYNKNEDNSPNIRSDKSYQVSSQKFTQKIYGYLKLPTELNILASLKRYHEF